MYKFLLAIFASMLALVLVATPASAATVDFSDPKVFSNNGGGIFVAGTSPQYSTVRVTVDPPNSTTGIRYQFGTYGTRYFKGVPVAGLGKHRVCVDVKTLRQVSYTRLLCKIVEVRYGPVPYGTPRAYGVVVPAGS